MATVESARRFVHAEGEAHARGRDEVINALDRTTTQLFLSKLDAEVAVHLDRLRSGNVELMSQFVFPLVRALTAELLGIEPPFRKPLEILLQPGLTFALYEGERLIRYPSVFLKDPESPGRRRNQLQEFVSTILSSPTNCLIPGALAELKSARERGGLSVGEAEVLGVAIAVASFEPISYQLGNILDALFNFPMLLNQLRNEPERIADAVVEMLRYDCAVQAAFRYAASDLTIGSQPILAGDQVVLLFGSANRDPRHFAKPDEIDFSRPHQATFALGRGGHACLGSKIAKLVLESILRLLLNRCDSIRRNGQTRWSSDLPMRGPTSLPCIISLVGATR